MKEKLADEAILEYLEVAKESIAQQRPADAQQAYRAILEINPKHKEAQQGLTAWSGGAAPAVSAASSVIPDVASAPAPVAAAPPPAVPEPQSQPVPVPQPEPEPEVAKPEAAPVAVAAEPEPVTDIPTMLENAVKEMDGGQYAEAETWVNQILAREPGNRDARQVSAQLSLKRGDSAAARAAFESLAEVAVQERDYAQAESLLREYLAADPKCVKLLVRLGHVCERSGDTTSAAIQYGKAIEVLLEHPDAERATLPAELYAKIKALAPNSPLVARFADAFGPSRLPESAPAVPATPPVLELEIGYHHDKPARDQIVVEPPKTPEAQPEPSEPSGEAPEDSAPERKRRRISYL
jgi:tetratricopeptide (TPR) repeat protein